MNRRKFLALLGVVSVGVSVPSVCVSSPPFLKKAIASIITRELHFLKLDKEGVDMFVSDFIPTMNNYSFIKTQRARIKITINYYVAGSIDRTKTPEIISHYLLSTDFFQNKMDESQIVRYMGPRNPYKNPCSNPFSHLYYPSTIS